MSALTPIIQHLRQQRNWPALAELAAQRAQTAIQHHQQGQRLQAVVAAEQAVEISTLLVQHDPTEHQPNHANYLSDLSLFLSEVGRLEEALAPAQEAVAIHRDLAEKNPAYCPDLAASLNNWVSLLGEVERWEEALAPAQEAVSILKEEMGKQNPAAYLRYLAASLQTWANLLSAAGRVQDAVSPAQEAVDIHRELAEENPAAYRPNLAGSLQTWATSLSEVGRREDALAPAQEAVAIHRELAEQNPDAYRPDLGKSLINWASRLGQVRRWEEALASAQEAVAIHRELAEQNPAAFCSYFAISLHNWAKLLSAVGRREETLKPTEEAVKLYRELARQNPAAYRPDLAESLQTWANLLSELKRWEEVTAPAQEAVATYRELAWQNPTAYRLDLAKSLHSWVISLSEVERWEEALDPAQEAVAIYRELAEQDPATYRPYLATSLHNRAKLLSEVGRREEALGPAREALDLHGELAKQTPATRRPFLAASLLNWAKFLSEMGRREEALDSAQKAVAIYGELAEQDLATYRPYLAMSLDTWASLLSAVERREEALDPAKEAVAIYRELAEQDPAIYRRYLATSLSNWASLLSEMGRRKETLDPAREAVRIHEAYAREHPGLGLNDAITCHSNLARRIREQEGPGQPDYRAAQVALRKAREYARNFRGSWKNRDQRARVLRESLHVHDLSIRNALDLVDTSDDPTEQAAALAEAVEAAEESRARALAERLAVEELDPRNAPSDLLAQFREAQRRLRTAWAQWERESGEGREFGGDGGARALRLGPSAVPTPGATAAAQNEAHQASEAQAAQEGARKAKLRQAAETAQAEHDEWLNKIHEHDPEYSPDGLPPVASLEAIRGALAPGIAAVQFVLLAEETVLLVVTQQAIEALRLPFTRTKAAEWANDWLGSYFHGRTEGREAATRHLATWQGEIDQRLAAVEQELLAPLMKCLATLAEPIERLVLCPHFSLHLVPWAALRLPEGQRLGERYELAQTASLSMLVRCTQRVRPESAPALLVTNPTEDLVFTELEAAALARHYPGAHWLHREQATREDVLARAHEARVFTYSGHMQFHPGEPLRGTAAVLAKNAQRAETTEGGSRRREEAGASAGRFVPPANWLTLADVFGELNLTRCRLAVLNGCESAMLRPDLTDDAESLTTGFLFAGAPAVISTLWAVWDISAALLMDKFHGLWKSGQGQAVAAALREAQRWLREDIRDGQLLMQEILPEFLAGMDLAEPFASCEGPPFAAPGHWAGFIASGAAF